MGRPEASRQTYSLGRQIPLGSRVPAARPAPAAPSSGSSPAFPPAKLAASCFSAPLASVVASSKRSSARPAQPRSLASSAVCCRRLQGRAHNRKAPSSSCAVARNRLPRRQQGRSGACACTAIDGAGSKGGGCQAASTCRGGSCTARVPSPTPSLCAAAPKRHPGPAPAPRQPGSRSTTASNSS